MIPDDKKYNNVEIPFGTSFIMQTSYNDVTIDYAGQVMGSAKEFTITSGCWNMTGNCSPVALVYGDITANETFAFGEDTLQTLTGTGGTDLLLTYLSPEVAEADYSDFAELGLTAGWYDYNFIADPDTGWDWESEIPADKKYNAIAVPAGFGFIMQSSYEGAAIEIPSPLAD